MVHCQRGAFRGRGLIQGVGPVIHTRRRPIPCEAAAIATAAIAAAICTLTWFSCRVMYMPECFALQTATQLESVPLCSFSWRGWNVVPRCDAAKLSSMEPSPKTGRHQHAGAHAA